MESLIDILNRIRERNPAFGRRMSEAEAVGRWDQAVGPQIARHARPLIVRDKVLWVEVDHPIWRSELHHRKKQILDAMNRALETSETVIEDILFVEPRS